MRFRKMQNHNIMSRSFFCKQLRRFRAFPRSASGSFYSPPASETNIFFIKTSHQISKAAVMIPTTP